MVIMFSFQVLQQDLISLVGPPERIADSGRVLRPGSPFSLGRDAFGLDPETLDCLHEM